MTFETKLIPPVQFGQEPVILRGRLHNDIIRRVNANTLRVRPPRMADEDDQLLGDNLAAQFREEEDLRNTVDGVEVDAPQVDEEESTTISLVESSRTTSSVRVEDPDDPNTFVDVDRIDTVTMVGTDGNTYVLTFSNT